jgi:hypothetical protein
MSETGILTIQDYCILNSDQSIPCPGIFAFKVTEIAVGAHNRDFHLFIHFSGIFTFKVAEIAVGAYNRDFLSRAVIIEDAVVFLLVLCTYGV